MAVGLSAVTVLDVALLTYDPSGDTTPQSAAHRVGRPTTVLFDVLITETLLLPEFATWPVADVRHVPIGCPPTVILVTTGLEAVGLSTTTVGCGIGRINAARWGRQATPFIDRHRCSECG